MNTFANAVVNQEARTENGMKARSTSGAACMDLFYSIGASRGKNVVPSFTAAKIENSNLALRIVQWARDIRGGAGERQLFRDVLQELEVSDPDTATLLAAKVPTIGRWDDLLAFKSLRLRSTAFAMIAKALFIDKNGLCAKWMPRKGEDAIALRNFLNLTPKAYRKLLVELTKVVESQMCAKDWDNINFSQVPSLAAARYRNAFSRNTDKFSQYVEQLKAGTNPEVKVNAGAVYPYDVLKDVIGIVDHRYYSREQIPSIDIDFINAQWAALPNYMGDNKVLPMVDVSGSMGCSAGGSKTITCMDVALSLGLYCADKNQGKFKDMFLTFSDKPELQVIRGEIMDKLKQMHSSSWNMNTNIVAAFDKILKVAKDGNVPQEEMPDMLLILSDMQFDECASFDDSAFESVKRKYAQSGYVVPKIVFWNLNAHSNVPVSQKENGTALVSGFSPSILTALLSGDMEEFTPEAIMLKTVMNPRYDF